MRGSLAFFLAATFKLFDKPIDGRKLKVGTKLLH